MHRSTIDLALATILIVAATGMGWYSLSRRHHPPNSNPALSKIRIQTETGSFIGSVFEGIPSEARFKDLGRVHWSPYRVGEVVPRYKSSRVGLSVQTVQAQGDIAPARIGLRK